MTKRRQNLLQFGHAGEYELDEEKAKRLEKERLIEEKRIQTDARRERILIARRPLITDILEKAGEVVET